MPESCSTPSNTHITTVGGQALIEGLMMIGPKNVAIAVRKADGEIVTDLRAPLKKGLFSKIPIIRGTVLLFKQLFLGVSALMFSAEHVDIETEEETKPSKLDVFLEKHFGDKLKSMIIVFSVIVSIFMSVALFILLPNILATIGMIPFDETLRSHFTWNLDMLKLNRQDLKNSVMYNLIEGVVRVSIFFLYIILAAKISPEIKRVWQYHGAEHKTIHCYEAGEELTVENIKKFTPLHPRCGTSFLFTVMIVSILIFSLSDWIIHYFLFNPVYLNLPEVFNTGWRSMAINILTRLTLVPLVAGASYELFKVAGRSKSKFWSFIKYPGLLFQRFTTAEPDDKMLEVAIVAMNLALTNNKEDDKW